MTAPEPYVLKADHLTVSIETGQGRLVPVDDVSFGIRRGETFALVGESGCGKSITALALMRLLPDDARIDSGSVTLNGQELLRLPESRMQGIRGRSVSLVFQEPSTSLNPVMTVGNQIGEVLSRHLGLRGRALREEAVRWLRRVGIPEPERRVDSFPFELSGGQKQRCMIAIALAARPDVVIADEPTTALDVTLQKQILELLASLQKETGMALLLITHDLSIVKKMAHRVALMYAGGILEEAPCAEFFSSPAHPYAKALLAALPSSGSKGRQLASIPGAVPPLSGAFRGCRFADRCPQAEAACRESPPPRVMLSSLRWCDCRHPSGPLAEIRPAPREASRPDSGSARPLLSVTDYHVWFEQRGRLPLMPRKYTKAVDGVELSLARGETLALVGESGSGKTTLAKALLRLLPQARISGRGQVCGVSVGAATRQELKCMRRRAQIIFQDPFSSLDPRMTIRDTLLEGLESLRQDMSGAQRDRRVRELLELVGLPQSSLGRLPHEFSGGQRQRIAIARALAPEPDMLICDEPTSALDVSVQAQVLNLMVNIQRETGIAYLLITHNFGVVEYAADRVCVMKGGKIVEQGPVGQVLSSPRTPYTRELLQAVPRL